MDIRTSAYYIAFLIGLILGITVVAYLTGCGLLWYLG